MDWVLNKLLEYFWENKKDIVTMEDLANIARDLYFNYKNIINYLIKKKEIIRIYGDLYYIKKIDEINTEGFYRESQALKLISKAFEYENDNKWYFGLHTALRFHDISLKNHPNDYILASRKFFQKRKIILMGKNINVLVFNAKFFNFGIIKNGIKYSDLEKTFLDFIYLWKLKEIPNLKIKLILEKYREKLSQKKMMHYIEYYSSEVKQVIEEFFK